MSGPQQRRSRSPDDAEAPLLRKRVCREAPSFIGGESAMERRGGLSAAEWQQLYERVMPNPCTMSDFQKVVIEGKSHNHFFAKDLHKLVMELRVILESHGELRMAANLAVKGRKPDLAHGVAAALKCLESERRQLLAESLRGTGVDECCGLPCNVSCRTSGQTAVEAATSSTVSHSSTIGLGLLRSYRALQCSAVVSDPPSIQAGVGDLRAAPFASVCETDDALLLNSLISPFSRVMCVVKRFQLRFGSVPLRFEVPVQFVDAVVARRLRVQLTPFRHPAIPVRWPTAKDIVVYVNDQCVMTPWKRSWPERRVEVAKTLLLLDITQFLNRNVSFQKLQINVFSREYFSQVALLIVQPVPPDEVVTTLVKPLLSLHEETRDAAIFDLYHKVVEDEDAFLDEVEADDPVITSKCPILQTRISIPIRGSRCQHLQCFDCLSFLLSCNKGCYWNCPLCDAELRPCDIVVDTVLWRYLQQMGDACPLHLRLESKHKAKTGKMQKEKDTVEGLTTAPFCWVPHRVASDGHGVLLDDTYNDEGDNRDGSVGGSAPHLRARSAVVNGGHAVRREGETHGTLGIDGSNADFDKLLGTADCPIEL
ncbi:zinc finger protein, predicted [Trypanosoma rangeli]|uniref:Zinc finger protein, predicted n=1 Tax=Trypanosoma rangeli TaxID=5698 RepID=A0A422MY81_TRYRA|nr:zinc finger protein, predicted [Trypanosoma rangeli]RNE98176.1 zinc finger protein, predicted [Trypanosoma rangeli]|eukprot:RNE98176.1 zinc finger protein, predicted [Trypanosoma rangeli]